MTNTLHSLADPSSFPAIGWLFICVAAIATGLYYILQLLDRTKEKPSPPDTYVTREACRLIHNGATEHLQRIDCEVNAIRTEIREMGIRLNKDDEERCVAIHNRINTVEALVNKILGQVSRQK
jgi:hypothetical protein